MVANPFVEFARDPVTALSALAYLLFLGGLAMACAWWSLRMAGRLAVQWKTNHTSREWWSGPFNIGVVPPPKWSAWAVVVVWVWSVAIAAIAAVVWVVA